MNETELRNALRSTMSATTAPPPMTVAAALEKAHRARVRQRTIWAGAGAGLVAATVLAATAALPGAPGHSLNTGGPGVRESMSAWPTGPDGQPQEDRTAKAGERYEQGVALLDELVKAVPAGYTVPDGPEVRTHQAHFDDRIDGVDVWSYMAIVPVHQGERAGKMLAEVHTVGNELPADPCAPARQLWRMQGDCQVVTVGTAQVGVTNVTGQDQRYDQWASYRHPDGAVVYVAQAAQGDEGGPRLSQLPLTVQQLATLATSEQLHLD